MLCFRRLFIRCFTMRTPPPSSRPKFTPRPRHPWEPVRSKGKRKPFFPRIKSAYLEYLLDEVCRLSAWLNYGIRHDVEQHLLRDERKRLIWRRNMRDFMEIRREIRHRIQHDPPSLQSFERLVLW